MKMKPLIITIQGPAASGKTTLANALHRLLRDIIGHDVTSVVKHSNKFSQERGVNIKPFYDVKEELKRHLSTKTKITIIDDVSTNNKFDKKVKKLK